MRHLPQICLQAAEKSTSTSLSDSAVISRGDGGLARETSGNFRSSTEEPRIVRRHRHRTSAPVPNLIIKAMRPRPPSEVPIRFTMTPEELELKRSSLHKLVATYTRDFPPLYAGPQPEESRSGNRRSWFYPAGNIIHGYNDSDWRALQSETVY